MNTDNKKVETKKCDPPSIGSRFTLYQGTEFSVEKLNLLIVVNYQLNKLNRIDLENQTSKVIAIPKSGIPEHFKKIKKDGFNKLIEKYFF